MIRVFHMEIHEATVTIDQARNKIYTFLLCNGDSYEFAIPTLEHQCDKESEVNK